ncbi:MAG: Asp-tRNA(Asn)/Glu-tRNA(Gln) amidotransferase subunit GatC [Candidatus Babeliales bacterium]
MTKITDEEARTIAALSMIEINEEQLHRIAMRLQEVLDYAQKVQKAISCNQVEQTSLRSHVNVMRQDVAQQSNSQSLVDQAPKNDNNYFVVPQIIKNT